MIDLTRKDIETITAILRQSFNMAAAAGELDIHRNTLLGRIDRFKVRTGYDLREFKDVYSLLEMARSEGRDEILRGVYSDD